MLAAYKTSAMIYFAFAGATVFLCVVGFLLLERLPITKYYLQQHRAPQDEEAVEEKVL